MRFIVAFVSCLVIATPAMADPFTFTFTGTMGKVAQLTHADGTIVDLGLSPVTITGFITGVDPLWTAFSPTGSLIDIKRLATSFVATTTYDFGTLGSFTTQNDHYVERYQFAANGFDRELTRIGLYAWSPGDLDQAGFTIGLAPVAAAPFSDSPVPFDVGDVTPLNTISNLHTLFNPTSGERLFFALAVNGQQMQITSTVAGTPEPASGLLLLLGGTIAGILRRRHVQTNHTA